MITLSAITYFNISNYVQTLDRYVQTIDRYEEVKTVIFRYIFGYYNTQRINSFNAGGLPPVALRTSAGLAHYAA